MRSDDDRTNWQSVQVFAITDCPRLPDGMKRGTNEITPGSGAIGADSIELPLGFFQLEELDC